MHHHRNDFVVALLPVNVQYDLRSTGDRCHLLLETISLSRVAGIKATDAYKIVSDRDGDEDKRLYACFFFSDLQHLSVDSTGLLLP